MSRPTRTALALLLLTAPASNALASTAQAHSVLNTWSSIKPPAAPKPVAVTLNPKTTALLLLDFVAQTCNATHRPRCLATLKPTAALLARARAAHATIIYSYVLSGHPADINPALAPRPGAKMVQSGPDKFLHTNLAALLRADHIRTVIVTGTAAEGAVLATGSEAAYRGYRVILPADGLSAAHRYAEQYTIWDFLHAPFLSNRTTLTTLGEIHFR
jgi:nicotinamidase-related amidase